MNIFAKILGRLSEPSTYAGLAAITVGLGEVAKINEATAIAEAVGAAGQAVASGGGWAQALLIGGLGILSAFMPEKGKRD